MIELLSPQEFASINRKLRDRYSETENRPNFKLVWADDEKERRATHFTPEGIQLPYTVVRLLRKYPDIRERYVLEWLRVNLNFDTIADGNPVEELIYVPCWTFEVLNEKREKCYIAPNFGACKFVIEIVLNNVAQAGNYTKYVDPEINSDAAAAEKEKRVSQLMLDLFGDESAITDALSIRQGVAYGQGSSPNSTIKGDKE